MALKINLELNTDDENMATLCRRYWELDGEHFKYKVSGLSREFGLASNRLTKLVAHGSKAFSTEDVCSGCERPYTFSSRSDFQIRNARRSPWVCDECRKREAELREAERLLATQRYRELIQKQYSAGNPVRFEPLELSLETAVYLLSFIRLLAEEDFSFARPMESAKQCLSPTGALDLEIVKHLYEQRLIFVSPNSRLDAFEGDKAETFYLLKVQWHLPIGSRSDSPKDFASDLEEILRGNEWPGEWRVGSLDLWKKVALNECLQYLAIALNEHGFTLQAGEKTILVFNNLLESFSVAQIYNMIWRATKDAAAFYVRGGVTKQHAANTVVGAMQRYGERARAESWPIKPFSRHFDCPQSVVSEVLYNAVLRIGEDGFKRVPDKIRLGALPQFSVVPSTQLVH